MYTSKLKPIYTAFLHSMKLSVYRARIKTDNDVLAIIQNNYVTKIVNKYIVFELDVWRRIPLNNFKLKNCLFGATNTLTNKNGEVYSGYGIAFVGASLYNFRDENAKNVVIFGLDNVLLSHAGNKSAK